MPTIPDQALSSTLTRRMFSLGALTAVLSACGGGDDNDEAPPTAPLITTQPGNVSIMSGAIATFRVAAQSAAPLSYQWYRNGFPIEGAKTAELSVGPVNGSESGSSFFVVVANSAGTVQSATATLLIQVAEGIALAQGVLSMLSKDNTVVGFGKGGDVFVWERGSSPKPQDPMRLVRLASDRTPRPLLGNKQTLDLNSPWRVSVLEHSDGNLYVSESYVTGGGAPNLFRGGYGKIHRITPDGGHSVIYHYRTAATAITPVVLAEGPGAKLYALNLNNVSVYEIQNTGALSQATVLTKEPIEDLGMSFARNPYLNMATTKTGGIFVSPVGTVIKPVYDAFGGAPVSGLASAGNHIYGLVTDANGYVSLVRRNPEGLSEQIAGGVATTESGAPEVGPLSGSLGNAFRIRLVGITPEGSIVLGEIDFDGYSPQDFRYGRYFVVTPPKI